MCKVYHSPGFLLHTAILQLLNARAVLVLTECEGMLADLVDIVESSVRTIRVMYDV